MRPPLVAVTVLLAFSTSIAGAQPSQTLTLEPVCTGDAGGYFNYDIEIIVTGLGPWGAAVGSVETPDGFQIGPTGFSAGADGTARINLNSILPGLFEARVYEPFKARESLYVDCGRPRPVERAACKGHAWQSWGFASRRECLQYVEAAKECAYQHYQGNDVTPCPPRLPKRGVGGHCAGSGLPCSPAPSSTASRSGPSACRRSTALPLRSRAVQTVRFAPPASRAS